ncbi:MAG TPA: hypothetical protein VHP12_01360, partial [Chitinophagaceae bacterium]|nr:hypothetical protein [Chitinophagaceae bacterium]
MGKNKFYILSLLLVLFFLIKVDAQQSTQKNKIIIHKNLSDDQLLDLVQKQTFRYFWDFAHPVSGMARERSNTTFGYGNEVVTTGGTGFGVMSSIVATN